MAIEAIYGVVETAKNKIVYTGAVELLSGLTTDEVLEKRLKTHFYQARSKPNYNNRTIWHNHLRTIGTSPDKFHIVKLHEYNTIMKSRKEAETEYMVKHNTHRTLGGFNTKWGG